MMISFATSIYLTKPLLPISAAITAPSFTKPSRGNCIFKINRISTSRKIFVLPLADVRQKVRSHFAADPNRASPLPSNLAFWEDPDDGSGSEYDGDDEADKGEGVTENNLDFESDWEEDEEEQEEEEEEEEPEEEGEERVPFSAGSLSADKPSVTVDQHAEDLLKEVEQLLEPEEREILLQNATPKLDKISTAKWNPLHSLALAGQIRHMDMLLGNGVNIDLVDKDGLTALHTAIIGKKEAVISHLLRKGASPNVRDQDGASPLHYAVQVGAMQTVKLLIKYNVDLNAADNEGWTPLHIAIQSRNRDIAKVLLVNGADKTRRNKDGRTPLDLALCYGKDFKAYDLAKLLKIVPASRDL
ncbi:hypothetical protein NMG60_11006567 [Bertholletia excelsa]